MKGHPKWSLKTGSLTRSTKMKPEERSEAPRERQMVTTHPWGSLRYEGDMFFGGIFFTLFRGIFFTSLRASWNTAKCCTGRLKAFLNRGIFFTYLTDRWAEACGHQTAVKVATLDALRLLPTRMAGLLPMTFGEIEYQHHTCYDILCDLSQ